MSLTYKGQPLKQTYVPDFVCFGTVIVEIKALREFAPEHRAQVLNYLKASGMRLERVRVKWNPVNPPDALYLFELEPF
ncbi:MAG: GxxExxY protein [Phenylobacterium sp.]|nr:GxxExxY protein [Phenylobacterium sp.]MDO8798804.1 GxxExxY protein [Phenylobacterium sp.]